MAFHRKITKSYSQAPDYYSSLSKLFNIGQDTASQDHYIPLSKNDEALAWRMSLIDNATHTIDAQYYSWHTDISGKLLISQLIDAADRGVRVRLLLDDIHIFGKDRQIATLNRHHNIEVRIFNPFRLRWPYRFIWIIELLFNLNRLNHRMHNKLLVVDNLAAIIGGRNIADEYFSLNPDMVFRDLDLLIHGGVVTDLSNSFDIYWNSPVTKTARRLIAFRPGKIDFHHLKKWLDKSNEVYAYKIQKLHALKSSLQKSIDSIHFFTSSTSRVFYDSPDITGLQGEVAKILYEQNQNIRQKLTIISAYFVPNEALLSSFQTLINEGVIIDVFTNSLESIDVTAAFSGYQRYRFRLLKLGVNLFEYRSRPEHISGLHAKSIIYDDYSIYIGTFNVDPRSALLNTEVAMLIEDESLAKTICEAFYSDQNVDCFWEVKYNKNGILSWNCGNITTERQPARNIFQRFKNFLYFNIPIHEQL